jgi:flagellar motor switch protein FliG
MLKTKRPALSSNPLPSSLNLLFNGLSDEAIQDFLKEINTHDLAKVFKQMNAKTQKRVFKTLPQRAGAFLRETLEQQGQVPPSELTEAQERVEAVLKELLQRPAPPELAG